jgi:thiosulfate reductase cytochrome b subunit
MIDPHLLLAYLLGALFVGWILYKVIGGMIEQRRNFKRWRAEDAALNAQLDAALAAMDDEERSRLMKGTHDYTN